MDLEKIDQWTLVHLIVKSAAWSNEIDSPYWIGFEPRTSRLQMQIFHQSLVVWKNGFSKHWSVNPSASYCQVCSLIWQNQVTLLRKGDKCLNGLRGSLLLSSNVTSAENGFFLLFYPMTKGKEAKKGRKRKEKKCFLYLTEMVANFLPSLWGNSDKEIGYSKSATFQLPNFSD